MYKFKQAGIDVEEDIIIVRKEIAGLIKQKSKEIIFNTRIKNTRIKNVLDIFFFLNLEKKIQIEEMEGEKEICGILQKVHDFYSNLFNEKTVNESFINDAIKGITNILDFNSQQKLNRDFTEAEVLNTIKSFKKGKVPGPDGLPIEFYLCFYKTLKDDLFNIFREVFISKTLPHLGEKEKYHYSSKKVIKKKQKIGGPSSY